MIVIGFMVMFRRKIDPKTVITVQNALPKIVLALLLVTFSYAIAAFMIDLMYLVMAIIINLLVSAASQSFLALIPRQNICPATSERYLTHSLAAV